MLGSVRRREAGSPGGLLARELVLRAFAEAGYEPELQPLPAIGGANVLARLAGESERWVIVAAHYDHVGQGLGGIYPTPEALGSGVDRRRTPRSTSLSGDAVPRAWLPYR